MTRVAVALGCGVLFGAGLALGHMTDPAVVLAFLDVAGDWNPSLAFVMGGALAVTVPATWWARRRGRTLLGAALALPSRRSVDAPLLAGAALFGVGWGLVGLCPGPALAALVSGSRQVLLFALAMGAGMALHDAIQRRGGRAGLDQPAASMRP